MNLSESLWISLNLSESIHPSIHLSTYLCIYIYISKQSNLSHKKGADWGFSIFVALPILWPSSTGAYWERTFVWRCSEGPGTGSGHPGLTVGGSFRKTITRALRHLWNHYLGLFNRWFCYFPNGQSTIWGIYSEYFLFFGDPLSKSKIGMIILGNPCFRLHVEFRRCNFAKCDGLYGFGSWTIMGIFMGNDPTVGLNQVWDLKPTTYNWTGWWFGTMEFYDFPIQFGIIIPTDELTPWFFRGVSNHQNRWNPRLHRMPE